MNRLKFFLILFFALPAFAEFSQEAASAARDAEASSGRYVWSSTKCDSPLVCYDLWANSGENKVPPANWDRCPRRVDYCGNDKSTMLTCSEANRMCGRLEQTAKPACMHFYGCFDGMWIN